MPEADCGPESVPLPEIFPRRTVLPALRGCKVPLTAKVGLSEPKVLPLLSGEKRIMPPGRMLIVPVFVLFNAIEPSSEPLPLNAKLFVALIVTDAGVSEPLRFTAGFVEPVSSNVTGSPAWN